MGDAGGPADQSRASPAPLAAGPARLRVGNERVREGPEDCLHILVYAVPSSLEHEPQTALLGSASAWAPTSKGGAPRAGAFVVFSTTNAKVSSIDELPNWW